MMREIAFHPELCFLFLDRNEIFELKAIYTLKNKLNIIKKLPYQIITFVFDTLFELLKPKQKESYVYIPSSSRNVFFRHLIFN